MLTDAVRSLWTLLMVTWTIGGVAGIIRTQDLIGRFVSLVIMSSAIASAFGVWRAPVWTWFTWESCWNLGIMVLLWISSLVLPESEESEAQVAAGSRSVMFRGITSAAVFLVCLRA